MDRCVGRKATLRCGRITSNRSGNELFDDAARMVCGGHDEPSAQCSDAESNEARARRREPSHRAAVQSDECAQQQGRNEGERNRPRMFSKKDHVAKSIGIASCAMAEMVSINFADPVALIPLPGVVLLPHTALPLHIFEPRYRQMIRHALEGSPSASIQPIAVASIMPDAKSTLRDPPLREVVCVAHIVQHQSHADGRFDIVLQGLCRAAIERLDAPDGKRLYRQAILRPLENPGAIVAGLGKMRNEMRALLSGLRFQRMQSARAVLGWIERKELSHQAALELVAFALVKDEGLRYRILAESDAYERAKLVWGDLHRTDRFIAKAELQLGKDAPRGVSWN